MINQIVSRSWSHTFVVTSLVVAVCTCATFGDVKLPAIISDNMVLQAGDANVWGWAAPGEEVVVRLGPDPKNKPNQIISRSARADGDGCWSVTMTPATPSLFGGHPMKLVVTGKNEQVVKNVVIGEVWICSGQSNMEWSVRQSLKGEQLSASGDVPGIRMFKVNHVSTSQKQDDVTGSWRISTPKNVPHFSGVGYVFAKEIHESLGEPVGMISTNWGGSVAEAWMSREHLEATAALAPLLKRTDADPPGNNHRPAHLYNGMIHPILNYGIRGAIWYQGESNVGRAAQYGIIFPEMIKDWRDQFNSGDFPFYFVQIAPYNYNRPEATAELRESQDKTQQLKKTGMVVTMDVGNPGDIHPQDKTTVGKRLAAWALANDYGMSASFRSPNYKVGSLTLEGSQASVAFENTIGQLSTSDGKVPSDFTIAGPDMVFHPGIAVLNDNTVVVTSNKVTQPIAVRYAWSDAAQPNLIGGSGLPATPFRTDEWPRVTEKHH
jgi:sialate O-acetylesterase